MKVTFNDVKRVCKQRKDKKFYTVLFFTAGDHTLYFLIEWNEEVRAHIARPITPHPHQNGFLYAKVTMSYELYRFIRRYLKRKCGVRKLLDTFVVGSEQRICDMLGLPVLSETGGHLP